MPKGVGVSVTFQAFDKGLMLESSAIHQASRAKNIPYQPFLIKTKIDCTSMYKYTEYNYSNIIIM